MLTEKEHKEIEATSHDKYPVYPVYADCLDSLKWTNYIKHLRMAYTEGATQERIKAKALETGLEMISKHSTDPYAIDRANRALSEYNTKQIEP